MSLNQMFAGRDPPLRAGLSNDFPVDGTRKRRATESSSPKSHLPSNEPERSKDDGYEAETEFLELTLRRVGNKRTPS
jgi:hypothetical protein